MTWLQEVVQNPFFEFTTILVLAAIIGAIGLILRQPLIVTFIALGIVVGPSVLNVVHSKDNIHLLAEIGIAVLLFIVGLKLDLRIIKSVGKIAALTGFGQVIFTSLFGYLIGLGLGFEPLHAFYIAVALTFSSTIIIVKLLSDKKEIDSLHGQIAIGFLIVQDIVVVLVMIVLSALRQDAGADLSAAIIQTLLAGVGMLVFALLAMRFIIPWLSHFLARSPELLTLFAIAWAVGLASGGELMGFSAEVGAFLAGVSLASSDYKELISNRLVSLRDFLLLFFFVGLGADLDLAVIGNQVSPALIFSVFVLVGNPVIVLIIMGLMGYRKRTSFLAGLTVAQISEFSLIFAGLGLAVGHINEDIVGLITLVGLITIGLSTYLILYSHQIYTALSPALSIFQRKNPFRESELEEVGNLSYDVVIFGFGRFGGRIGNYIDERGGLCYLAIDFDPSRVKAARPKNGKVIYGDADDPELLDHLPLKQAKHIISSLPDVVHARHLVKMLKRADYRGKIHLTAMNEQQRAELEMCGADHVYILHHMAAKNFYDSVLMTTDQSQ